LPVDCRFSLHLVLFQRGVAQPFVQNEEGKRGGGKKRERRKMLLSGTPRPATLPPFLGNRAFRIIHSLLKRRNTNRSGRRKFSSFLSEGVDMHDYEGGRGGKRRREGGKGEVQHSSFFPLRKGSYPSSKSPQLIHGQKKRKKEKNEEEKHRRNLDRQLYPLG